MTVEMRIRDDYSCGRVAGSAVVSLRDGNVTLRRKRGSLGGLSWDQLKFSLQVIDDWTLEMRRYVMWDCCVSQA